VSGVLFVFLPLVVAYGATLWWVVESWFHEGSYWSHGPLVPVVVIAVIWLRRAQWRTQASHWDPRGWILLLPALLLHLAGAALMVDSLSGASLVLAVPGAAWLALGRQRLRGSWPALWFVAFAIPLPIFVSGRLVFELKEIVVNAAIGLSNLLGVALTRSGAELHVPGQKETLLVADPCGGLNSLLSLLTLGYCVAFFVGETGLRRRLAILLLAGPIAILVNVARVTGICLLANWKGVPWASTTGHDLLNVCEWVLALMLLYVVDRYVSRWVTKSGGT